MDKLIDAIKKSSLGPSEKDDSSGIRNDFCFDNSFIGFSGHFPGYPILPAVAQLLVAQLVIEDQMEHKIQVTSIEKAKFLSEVKPNEKITVECIDNPKDGNPRSKVRITSGDRPVSSFNICYCLGGE